MFINFLKINLRNLRKNGFQSVILIGGLTAGIATCILLLQYVSFELSYDQFHSDAKNIYRVVNERFQNGKMVQKGTITYPTIGPTMKAEFPEVKNATRLAYRIDMEWWVFVVSGALAMFVAFLTVGVQSLKAALANPVKSIRNE